MAQIKQKGDQINLTGGIWTNISDDGKIFLYKLMTYDYKQRISALDALQDPWF